MDEILEMNREIDYNLVYKFKASIEAISPMLIIWQSNVCL